MKPFTQKFDEEYDDDVCDICDGEGTMIVDGYVYPGEAPRAPIYSDTCICILEQIIDEE